VYAARKNVAGTKHSGAMKGLQVNSDQGFVQSANKKRKKRKERKCAKKIAIRGRGRAKGKKRQLMNSGRKNAHEKKGQIKKELHLSAAAHSPSQKRKESSKTMKA